MTFPSFHVIAAALILGVSCMGCTALEKLHRPRLQGTPDSNGLLLVEFEILCSETFLGRHSVRKAWIQQAGEAAQDVYADALPTANRGQALFQRIGVSKPLVTRIRRPNRTPC
jgi:hypothetical protein